MTRYEVADSGKVVTLELQIDDGNLNDISRIRFNDVTLYHFEHTQPAIILDISMIPQDELLDRHGELVAEWARQLGVAGFSGDLSDYHRYLIDSGYNAWLIEGSIGIYAFVICKSVVQL